MEIKKGAILTGLKMEMRPVLVEAGKLWRKYGQKLVVTEGLGGEHSAGSLHYYGYAVDLRTRYFDTKVQKEIHQQLKARLNDNYDVILHSSHIHVEYDRILKL